MSWVSFRLFGQRAKKQPPFFQQLETLYAENDYQGIFERARELLKDSRKRYLNRELKNKHLFPLLSDMARKLAESPNHLDHAIALSTQIIAATALEPAKIAKKYPYSHYADLQKVRDEEREFLSKVERLTKDQERKGKISAYLVEATLSGAFSPHSNTMSSLAVDDLAHVAFFPTAPNAGDNTESSGNDKSNSPLRQALDELSNEVIEDTKKSKNPAERFVGLFLEGLPYRLDCRVQKALAEELDKMSDEKAFDFCVEQALKIPDGKARRPTASYILEKVIEGIVNPKLVPDRKAFEKDLMRRTSSSYNALHYVFDDLRRMERDIKNPRPTRHGVRYFLARRKLEELHQ